MTSTVREKLDAGPLFDSAIIEHHFTPYMRDYDLLVDVPAAVPGGGESYIEGRYRYRFTHCVIAHVTTCVSDNVWRHSWEDVFINYAAWKEANEPEGFVWGVCWASAYPGLTYVENSVIAQEWTNRLHQSMHEVFIETEAYTLQLVFHDINIEKVAQDDPNIKTLTPLDI
jgi:hypothetical protein